MTAPITSKQWPRFLLPIVRKEWFQKMTSVVSAAAQFYGVDTSTSSAEYSQGMGDFGLVDEYNSADALGNPAAIPYDSFSPLYEKTFTHKEYVKGVAIERKLWDDDQKGNIRRRARALGNAFGTTIAVHQSSVFNNAFSATVVGADAVPLCSTSHPNRPNDAATLRSNKGTSPLSYAAMKATMTLGKRMVDDRGNPMPIIYDTLYVAPELSPLAYEIINAIGKPGTADNDANAIRNLKVVEDVYHTSTKNWFMIDSRNSREHLLWYWRVRTELDLDPASNYQLVAKYRGYMRYSFGWDDYMWIYGHEPA